MSRVVQFVAVALCMAAVGIARPRIATSAARIKERYDTYALPPSAVLPVASLGYKQALADMIWAHVLVTQGLRFSEKRPFDHLTDYLDAISTLDPKFREPYKYADSLLAFQVNDPDKEGSVRAARRFIERGLREHPTDADLWMIYGEFLAYVGSGVLTDPAEQERWREEGAAALMQAGRLGSKDEYLLWHSVAAVGLLSGKDAERDAIIRFLERVYAMTEDEELREHVLRKLKVLARDQAQSRLMRRQRAFDELWRKMPLVNRNQLRIIGPSRDAWLCAGPKLSALEADRCSRDWSSWSRGLGTAE